MLTRCMNTGDSSALNPTVEKNVKQWHYANRTANKVGALVKNENYRMVETNSQQIEQMHE